MKNFVFLKSAVEQKDYPFSLLPEVALVGRSNAGKSSFLNSLARTKLAFVSQSPGKTALINFFQVDKKGIIVDLPGYGFAKRSKAEIKKWQSMIENYLVTRENLRGLVLLMDVSRDWAIEEQQLFDFASSYRIPMALVLTKIDRLSSNQLYSRKKTLVSSIPFEPYFFVSNKQREGIDAVEKFVEHEWMKGKIK